MYFLFFLNFSLNTRVYVNVNCFKSLDRLLFNRLNIQSSLVCADMKSVDNPTQAGEEDFLSVVFRLTWRCERNLFFGQREFTWLPTKKSFHANNTKKYISNYRTPSWISYLVSCDELCVPWQWSDYRQRDFNKIIHCLRKYIKNKQTLFAFVLP